MQSDVDDFEFETVLIQCTEAISEETGDPVRRHL